MTAHSADSPQPARRRSSARDRAAAAREQQRKRDSRRRLLIIGASGVVRWAKRKGVPPGSWLAGMLERKPPMLVIVATATLMSRTIEPRSVYDARLSDAEVAKRQRSREQAEPGS